MNNKRAAPAADADRARNKKSKLFHPEKDSDNGSKECFAVGVTAICGAEKVDRKLGTATKNVDDSQAKRRVEDAQVSKLPKTTSKTKTETEPNMPTERKEEQKAKKEIWDLEIYDDNQVIRLKVTSQAKVAQLKTLVRSEYQMVQLLLKRRHTLFRYCRMSAFLSGGKRYRCLVWPTREAVPTPQNYWTASHSTRAVSPTEPACTCVCATTCSLQSESQAH